MRRFLLIWSFALLIGSVQASPIIYIASLSGPSESPPNISPGTGNAIVTYDSEAHTLLVDAVFQDLTAGNTAAHIHCCTASAGSGAAGVATMTPTFAGFPTGATSGIYDSPVFDLTQPGVWNASFITNNGGTPASAESVFGASAWTIGSACTANYRRTVQRMQPLLLNDHETALQGGRKLTEGCNQFLLCGIAVLALY